MSLGCSSGNSRSYGQRVYTRQATCRQDREEYQEETEPALIEGLWPTKNLYGLNSELAGSVGSPKFCLLLSSVLCHPSVYIRHVEGIGKYGFPLCWSTQTWGLVVVCLIMWLLVLSVSWSQTAMSKKFILYLLLINVE